MKATIFASIVVLLQSVSAATRGYEKKKTPPPTPAPTQKQHCDYDYEALGDLWSIRKDTWDSINTGCYNMTVRRFCFGCSDDYQGPLEVVVRNNRIVSLDATKYDLNTMNELFDLVSKECIEGCPGDGAAQCTVQYAPKEKGSYITSIFINPDYLLADGATSLSISNLAFCS